MKALSFPAKTGFLICTLIFIAALLSMIWTPYNVTDLDIEARLTPPTSSHWLGADHLGRDTLSMLMIGARISILVAFAAVSFGLLLGTPLGLLSAAYERSMDEITMRGSDIIFAFPAIITAILITAIFGPGAYAAVIAVGIFNIPVFARLARGAALPLWKAGFIQSAYTSGKSKLRISLEHILPNIAPVLAVQTTIQFSLAILAEAGLSYVGLGVQPPAPSWGRMLAESQSYAGLFPRLAITPGLAIFLLVLGINLAGEGIREQLKIKQRPTLA